MLSIEELKTQVDINSRHISDISKRLHTIESHLSIKPVQAVKPVKKIYPEHKVEHPTSLFRIFGGVGIFMILLGTIYFYKYAVDQGWIGITGRVALGILASFIIIGAGMVAYKKKYVNFSQVLIACGLGLMYFTIFATYHFDQYRQALGMNLTLNTILLLVVIFAGMLIGIKLDARFVVYGSILLGYIAAFLSGIDGSTLHILIYVGIIDVIVLLIARLKSWYIGIPALILTYIAYFIWFAQGIFDAQSILNQTSSPVLVTFITLLVYYITFTIISFIQASGARDAECMAISIINTISLTGFGLGIINKYYPDFNGIFVMGVAALTLFVGFLSKRFGFSKIFDLHFLMTCVLVAIAIPVQFDNSIVTILWVVMALGLAFGGVKTSNTGLFFTGFIGYLIPTFRVLFYDFWALDGIERWLAVGAGITGILVLQWLARVMHKDKWYYNIYNIAGVLLTMIWIPVELNDITNGSTFYVWMSMLWALFAIALIIYGVAKRRKIFNWMGVIMFGIVILKVLIVDLREMENIFRVIALVVVGALALVGSFTFVKNRDMIKEYM